MMSNLTDEQLMTLHDQLGQYPWDGDCMAIVSCLGELLELRKENEKLRSRIVRYEKALELNEEIYLEEDHI
jgi:hypothetical protein